jgi:hypothetical protein
VDVVQCPDVERKAVFFFDSRFSGWRVCFFTWLALASAEIKRKEKLIKNFE